MPVWASTGEVVPGEDATHNVVKTPAGTPWFYWPGWAFLVLTALVLVLMALSWYKFIFIPKYRGRKVVQ